MCVGFHIEQFNLCSVSIIPILETKKLRHRQRERGFFIGGRLDLGCVVH